jgi:hypothetical protein
MVINNSSNRNAFLPVLSTFLLNSAKQLADKPPIRILFAPRSKNVTNKIRKLNQQENNSVDSVCEAAAVTRAKYFDNR